MDIDGIINQINNWCKDDTENRCAFVLLAEKDKEEITNHGLLGGSSRIMATSLAIQMNRNDDTSDVINKSLFISELIKLTESIKE